MKAVMTGYDLSTHPDRLTAMTRGFRRRCPRCGQGAMFRSLLKLADTCSVCGEKLGDIRADDIPAYFTILVVGHVVVPLLLWAERFDPPSWLEFTIIVPLSLALTWLLLPRIKGAIAALLWHLNMRDGAPA
jgi:uncharacterized protein (DUF983 family)